MKGGSASVSLTEIESEEANLSPEYLSELEKSTLEDEVKALPPKKPAAPLKG